MMCHSLFVYSDDLLDYRFHSEHPFDQRRVLLTKDLLEAAGQLSADDIIKPRMATDEELKLFHDPAYITAVKKAGNGELNLDEGLDFGLGTEDTPMFSNMHEASAFLVGGTLTAVDAVLENQADHALHLGGGLHHGFKRKASGFCIYNDGAIAIQYIRKNYNLRVLYVDTDAHHGDGVQWAFYDDPNVCTFSIHETGRYLFPGTGNITERGNGPGYGTAFNFPVDAFTEDESFLYIYETALRKVIEHFKPDVILTQNGTDAHYLDPLTHLYGTMNIYKEIPKLARQLANEYCNGRWIAVGGGGYDIWRVVPRAWAHLWIEMSEQQQPTGPLPQNWLDKWQTESPVKLIPTWEDPSPLYDVIPRKKEIEEKNANMLQQALYTLEKQ